MIFKKIWSDKQFIEEHWNKLWAISGLLYFISGLIFIFIPLNNTGGISLITLGASLNVIGLLTSSKNNKDTSSGNMKHNAGRSICIKFVLVCSIVVLFSAIVGIYNYCYDSSYKREMNRLQETHKVTLGHQNGD